MSTSLSILPRLAGQSPVSFGARYRLLVGGRPMTFDEAMDMQADISSAYLNRHPKEDEGPVRMVITVPRHNQTVSLFTGPDYRGFVMSLVKVLTQGKTIPVVEGLSNQLFVAFTTGLMATTRRFHRQQAADHFMVDKTQEDLDVAPHLMN